MSATRALLAAAVLSLTAFSTATGARAQACMNDIMPLRNQVEKDGLVVKAAIEKKVDRSEICIALKKFVATEAKFIKYMDENAPWCGIPPDIVAQLKKSHARSTQLRGQACATGPNTAAAGPQLPAGPGLSDALGTSRTAAPTTPRSGSVFDTLSGPTLAR